MQSSIAAHRQAGQTELSRGGSANVRLTQRRRQQSLLAECDRLVQEVPWMKRGYRREIGQTCGVCTQRREGVM